MTTFSQKNQTVQNQYNTEAINFGLVQTGVASIIGALF